MAGSMDQSDGSLIVQSLKDADVWDRHNFIRKVYGIVGTQLLLTFGIAKAIMMVGEEPLRANPSFTLGLLLVSIVITIGTLCVFCCRPDLLKKFPLNYFIMFLFTVGESIVVGLISVDYTTESVLMAFGITCAVVYGLTFFACQTKYDFTGVGPYLFVAFLCFSCFGLFAFLGIFFLTYEAFHVMNVMYACCGALLFSCYLVYDTQRIVGGNHRRAEWQIDEYAVAAINLYVDIVQLFLYLLEIFGQRRGNSNS